MSIVWLIVKIIIYTFILSALFRLTFNFIFLLARRPSIWIVVIGLIGISNMWLAYALSWDPRLVSTATLTAIIMNIAPPLPKGISKTEFRASINAFYEGWGIAHGQLKSRLGLIVFAILSLAAYGLLFGETCTLSGDCTPILEGILNQ